MLTLYSRGVKLCIKPFIKKTQSQSYDKKNVTNVGYFRSAFHTYADKKLGHPSALVELTFLPINFVSGIEMLWSGMRNLSLFSEKKNIIHTDLQRSLHQLMINLVNTIECWWWTSSGLFMAYQTGCASRVNWMHLYTLISFMLNYNRNQLLSMSRLSNTYSWLILDKKTSLAILDWYVSRNCCVLDMFSNQLNHSSCITFRCWFPRVVDLIQKR